MKRLLHIEGSPRKKRSHSKALADVFIDEFRRKYSDAHVEDIDIWSFPLPDYDEITADAKFHIQHGQEFTPEEFERWHKIEQIFNHFQGHEVFLFSVPMWNFGIPYRLKHYIDILTQPKLAFNATASGYEGLVVNRRAVVIYTSGGDYSTPPAHDFDLQSRYLELWLHFIGFQDIATVTAASMLGSEELKQNALTKAGEQLRDLAQRS